MSVFITLSFVSSIFVVSVHDPMPAMSSFVSVSSVFVILSSISSFVSMSVFITLSSISSFVSMSVFITLSFVPPVFNVLSVFVTYMP